MTNFESNSFIHHQREDYGDGKKVTQEMLETTAKNEEYLYHEVQKLGVNQPLNHKTVYSPQNMDITKLNNVEQLDLEEPLDVTLEDGTIKTIPKQKVYHLTENQLSGDCITLEINKPNNTRWQRIEFPTVCQANTSITKNMVSNTRTKTYSIKELTRNGLLYGGSEHMQNTSNPVYKYEESKGHHTWVVGDEVDWGDLKNWVKNQAKTGEFFLYCAKNMGILYKEALVGQDMIMDGTQMDNPYMNDSQPIIPLFDEEGLYDMRVTATVSNTSFTPFITCHTGANWGRALSPPFVKGAFLAYSASDVDKFTLGNTLTINYTWVYNSDITRDSLEFEQVLEEFSVVTETLVLSYTPISDTIILLKNNVEMIQGIDYTVSGNNIVLSEGEHGDDVLVKYMPVINAVDSFYIEYQLERESRYNECYILYLRTEYI